MELKVGSIQGNAPNFRVTLNSDSSIETEGDLNINNQSYIPFGGGASDARQDNCVQGTIRFNTDDNILEYFSGTTWLKMEQGGGSGGSTGFVITDSSVITGSPRGVPTDFIIHQLDSAQTMLAWVSQYGDMSNQNVTDQPKQTLNKDSSTLSALYSGNYFTNSSIYFFNGDGTNDGGDWTIWDFDGANGNGDYDGQGDGLSFFAGENNRAMGSRYISGNNSGLGRIFGFSTSLGWELVYEMYDDNNNNSGDSHRNSSWYNAGSTVSSGNGKYAPYDSSIITHVGFGVWQ